MSLRNTVSRPRAQRLALPTALVATRLRGFSGRLRSAPEVVESREDERQEVLDRLVKSREHFRQVIDTSPEAFISINSEGLITAWNRQAEATFGWPFSRAIGQPLADLIIPERFRDAHVAGLARFRSEGKGRLLDKRMELTALHHDGHEFPIEITITTTRTKEGYEFNAFLHDITERRAAEIALQASADEIRDLYNNAPCGYHSLDRDGTFVRINDTELRWLGYERSEIIGKKKFSDIITPESLKTFRESFPRFKETGQVQGLEFEMVRKDGTIMPVLLNATAIRDVDGNYVMSRSTVFDITDRRRAEKLAQVRAELELRAAELERSNAELAQFAHAASHDLAEPIRTVSSYVQLLRDRYRGKLDSDADEFIGFVVDGAAQMQALIDGLRAYSTAGSAEYASEPIDCAELVRRVVRALQASVDEAGAGITVEDLPTVWGDATQLAEVFQNLLSNAVKFAGDEPPSVSVSAEREPKAWCFSVADNGIGIKPEHAHRIFDMFRRLHGRQAYPGTGIGLTICKKIVERHGGGIWVEPTAGGGSTFRFTIPDVQDAEALQPKHAAAASVPTNSRLT